MLNVVRENEQITGRILIFSVAVLNGALSSQDKHNLFNTIMMMPVKYAPCWDQSVGHGGEVAVFEVAISDVESSTARATVRIFARDTRCILFLNKHISPLRQVLSVRGRALNPALSENSAKWPI